MMEGIFLIGGILFGKNQGIGATMRKLGTKPGLNWRGRLPLSMLPETKGKRQILGLENNLTSYWF